jgi:TatD DNase family protein
MRLVDSHCHLDFPELVADLDGILERMAANGVERAMCISVTLDDLPQVIGLAERHPQLWATVGVHPDYEDTLEPTVEDLVHWARHPRVLAIGETGLDYYRLTGDLEWQRERFRTHIRAARQAGKPLVIHTRSAAADTLRIMEEEGAAEVGGVMHCFTETRAVADAAIAMNFVISFSGIVTFKNARDLQEVARTLPLDHMLVETDSPYLAPVPYRGKTNEPSWVVHVAEFIAGLRDIAPSEVAEATTTNFERVFLRGVT